MSSDSDINTHRSPPPAPTSRDPKKRPRRSQRTMPPPPPAKRHRSMAPSPQPKPEPNFGSPVPKMKKADVEVRHVFIVTQAGITPTTEPTFTIIGVFPTLVGANNKVIELWAEEKQLWQGGAEESKEKEGTIWWKAEDKWGNKMEVRAEKRELVSEGIGKEKRWGKDRPVRDENFVVSAF